MITETLGSGGGGGGGGATTPGWVEGFGDGGFRRTSPTQAVVDVSGLGLSSRNHRGFWHNGTHYITSDTGTQLQSNSVMSQMYLYTGPSLSAPLTSQGPIVQASDVQGINPAYNALVGAAISSDGSGGFQMYVPMSDSYYNGPPNILDVFRYTAPDPLGPWSLASTTPAIPSQTLASATLSAPLSTGAAITSLPVTALSAAVPTSAYVCVGSGTHYQGFQLSAAAAQGATTISVNSKTPIYAFPAGSNVVYAWGLGDASAPTYWNGQYLISGAWYNLGSGGAGRTVQLFSSPTPTGPWTGPITFPTVEPTGTSGLVNTDAPIVLAINGRLFLTICMDSYTIRMFEISKDLSTLWFMGAVLQVQPGDPLEGSNSQWGGGGMYQAGNQLCFVYQGMGSDNNYYKGFAATWYPGSPYVSGLTGWWVSNQTINNGSTNLNLPTWLPPDTIAVDLMVLAEETGTFTANEYLQLDWGGSSYQCWVYPQVANVQIAHRARVDIIPGATRVVRATATSSGIMKMWACICGYWRLP